jgi:hypothetical protein
VRRRGRSALLRCYLSESLVGLSFRYLRPEGLLNGEVRLLRARPVLDLEGALKRPR